ncbi:hypothetical protein VTO42DRAFT_4537 [Malbranchea cinnamomea]
MGKPLRGIHEAPLLPYSKALFHQSLGLQAAGGLYRPLSQLRARYAHQGTRQPHSSSPSLPPSAAKASSYVTVKHDAQISTSTRPIPPTPLSILPLSAVIRSLCITTISSFPVLLTPALGALSFLASSKSSLFNPDRNVGLKYLLGSTVFPQFCAGPTPKEVKQCVQRLKDLGFAGVILGYAPEVVMNEDEVSGVKENREDDRAKTLAEIDFWRKGTLATVDLADDGFVALKFSGAGKQALQHLLRRQPPSPQLEEAIVEICERAKARNVPLLFDAEQQAIQPTIDDWTIEFQRRYNNRPDRRALIYGTYQAYLRSTPVTLSRHMFVAQSEGFVLGVKLVRGAYLGTEPRHLIWATKEETDRTYDGIAESLIKRQYGEILKPDPKNQSSSFPEVNLLLASHNRASVERAQALRNEQVRTGQPKIEMAYGQLLGMADDLSCDLIHSGRNKESDAATVEVPKLYKYVVWGTVGECMKYLVRRGQENRDAASRTKDTRRAMAKELRRRMIGS